MIATVTNVSTRAMLKACAGRGVDAAGLLADTGIARRLVDEPGGRIPLEQVFNLWDEARRRTRNEALALHTAELLPFGSYKIIDYLAASSLSPREALIKASRFFRLVIGAFELQFRLHKDQAYIELHIPDAARAVSNQYFEYILATLLVRFRHTTGTNWTPREVHLTSSAPADLAEYHRLFQAPVRFKQPINRLALDRALLDLVHPQADPALNEILTHHAQRLLTQLPPEDDFINQFRQVLRQELNGGQVGLNALTRKLAMSRRALQRKLNSHGTSYSESLDQLRCELSLAYLKEGVEIAEIAFLLRFSEPSAFYRAFKRWTGKTPHAYLQWLKPARSPSSPC